MAEKNRIMGLSLTDKTVQAVELEQDGALNTLTAVDEWVNTLPSGTGENGEGTQRFVEFLSTFMKTNQVRAKLTSVALDSSLLFFNTIPLEEGLSRAEINDHVNWELAEYFPETPSREFITDTHVLTRQKTDPWSQMLSVSVRRQLTHVVQQALAKLGLALHIVDVDHFSADTALRVNYPDTNRKFLALIGVKENRLDVSMIKNGTMEGYSYAVVGSNQEIVDYIAALSREAKGIYAITAYGPYLDKDLLVQIRRASSLLVEALNPLRHVKIADSLRLADHLSSPSYRFASAVGVALRRD